jgi:hypothetical protein
MAALRPARNARVPGSSRALARPWMHPVRWASNRHRRPLLPTAVPSSKINNFRALASGCPDSGGLGHGNGSEPKSVAFLHLIGPAVVILMSALIATTGPGGGHHDLDYVRSRNRAWRRSWRRHRCLRRRAVNWLGRRPGCAQTQFLMTTFGMLIAFAVGVAVGCAAAAIALAGREHKPQHLPPEGGPTTYG